MSATRCSPARVLAGGRSIGAIAEKQGVEVGTKIVKGLYKEEILAEAEHHDVLAMHELRQSNWKDRLTGSSTERLSRNAPCSVLLIQTEEIE